MSDAYQAPWRPQVDGSAHQWDNCGPTGAGLAAKRFRQGKEPPEHKLAWNSDIRKQRDGTGWISERPTMAERIRQVIEQNPDGSWGTTIPQCLDAIEQLWGVKGDRVGYRFMAAWDDFVEYTKDGLVIVRIVYRYLHGTPYDACRTFDGGHIIVGQGHRRNVKRDVPQTFVDDPLADHRYPWIPQGPRWWDNPILRKAATENGAHGVEFGFVRDA